VKANPLRIHVGGTDMTPALEGFAEERGLASAAPGRISLFLIMQLLSEEQRGNDTWVRVLHEINALEGKSQFTSRMRPTTQFNHKPLKGLWHKHFRQTDLRSLSINLLKGLRRDGLPKLEAEVSVLEEPRDFEPADAAKIAHEAVVDNYERLLATQSLTGEWIVYSVFEGVNYYLCIASHDTGDDVVFNWINTACTVQFPFLLEQLHAQ
jgi:hypothetical protein